MISRMKTGTSGHRKEREAEEEPHGEKFMSPGDRERRKLNDTGFSIVNVRTFKEKEGATGGVKDESRDLNKEIAEIEIKDVKEIKDAKDAKEVKDLKASTMPLGELNIANLNNISNNNSKKANLQPQK